MDDWSRVEGGRMQESLVKRPRLRMIDLATINDALDCHIQVLKKQEATAKLDDPDKWIQAREKLHWKVLNAKNAQIKVVMNLKGVECGRTPKTLRHLLNLTAIDGMGEYLGFAEALELMPVDVDTDTLLALVNASRSGVVDSRLEINERGEEQRKFRKLDVARLAAFMEVHG